MQNILVIRFSSLGDLVLTEPIIRQLHRSYPDSKIHLLTKWKYADLAAMIPNVSQVHLLADDGGSGRLIDQLKALSFEFVIDLHNNLRSRRISSALGIKILRAKKEFFKREAAVKAKWLKSKPSHAVERYSQALKPICISLDVSHPQLKLPAEARNWWITERSQRQLEGNYFCIAPGSRHATKAAPAELWVECAKKLNTISGRRLLLIGSPSEKSLLSDLSNTLGSVALGILAEESLTRAAAALAAADFTLANDSGIAHLSAALNRPTLALFGPTHPILGFAPLGEFAAHHSVNEFCSPCSRHGSKGCYRERRYCFSKMDSDKIVSLILELKERAAAIL